MRTVNEATRKRAAHLRALTVCASTTLVPVAVTGEPWDHSRARALLCGVDTLYMSFDLPVSQAMWARLDQEQQIAQQLQQERRAVHCPEWLGASMRPTGAKGGYRFLIESNAWSIKLVRDIPNRPPIFVEMRAFTLKTHAGGVIGACQEVCTYLQDVLLEDQDPRTVCKAINLDVARCSRLDLHGDWQGGWHPTLAEGEHRLFIRPGQVDWHPFLSGNACTGYVFGKGHVVARLYNKTRQAKQSHLDCYFTLLEQHNGTLFDPAQDVWRLEFQLMRAGVQGVRLARGWLRCTASRRPFGGGKTHGRQNGGGGARARAPRMCASMGWAPRSIARTKSRSCSRWRWACSRVPASYTPHYPTLAAWR